MWCSRELLQRDRGEQRMQTQDSRLRLEEPLAHRLPMLEGGMGAARALGPGEEGTHWEACGQRGLWCARMRRL